MQAVEKFGPVVGRTLLVIVFLLSGVNKVFNWDGTAGYMASVGMPMIPLFLAGAIVLEIGGSLSVILGFKARWGALALIVFTIPTTLIFHAYWSVDPAQMQLQMIMFMKNLGLTGGLLMVMAFGAGPVSLDAKSGGR
ncbi:MAG: DoxX family protein [Inquilinus sp.]|nr:DoxX family protein [Inquilinus sp.]